MQLIINIDEDIITAIKENRIVPKQLYTLFDSIVNGTPLPKGHGRLIDADAYIDKHEECGWLDDITIDEFNAITPTIIEADKAESEEV